MSEDWLYSNYGNSIKELNKSLINYVEDLRTTYQLTSAQKNITYSGFFQNKMLLIHSIRRGIPYSLYDQIKNLMPFTETDWADFLNISVKTLQRNKKEKAFHFKPIHSEKILELAEVNNAGLQVFDNPLQFYTWLNTPSFALANMKPMDLLKDSYGKELVMEELNRIDQGIFV